MVKAIKVSGGSESGARNYGPWHARICWPLILLGLLFWGALAHAAFHFSGAYSKPMLNYHEREGAPRGHQAEGSPSAYRWNTDVEGRE